MCDQPVSERLRLHYIEGAHAGLRGDWARLIRKEAAWHAQIEREWWIALRDESKTWQKAWKKAHPPIAFPDQEVPF